MFRTSLASLALALVPQVASAQAVESPPSVAQQPAGTGEDAAGRPEMAMTPEKAAQLILDGIEVQREGVAQMPRAEADLPEGFVFLDGRGTRELMRRLENPSSDAEQGTLAPADLSWFVVLEFDPIGYVKDDDRKEIAKAETRDKMLDAFRQGISQGNERRRQLGFGSMSLIGWAVEPFYNEESKVVEHGIIVRDEHGEESVNYSTKVLGRHGVTEVTLVCSPDQLPQALPQVRTLIAGYRYRQGESYGEYRRGDKVAQYGLIGLVTGGALLAAGKAGLLAKLWKPIAVGGLAVGAFLTRIWKRLTGRGQQA